MIIDATSEAIATEVVRQTTYLNSSHNVWYAIRLVCWLGTNGEGQRVIWYKWQKGDNGWHAYRLDTFKYTVSYAGGPASEVSFSPQYSTTGWTDCCSPMSVLAAEDSGTIRATGTRFWTNYDQGGSFDASESVSLEGVSGGGEDEYTPLPLYNNVLSRYFLYIDDRLAYAPYLYDYQVLDAALEEEVNQSAVIKFKIPATHPFYEDNNYGKYRTNIELREGSDIVFRGRVTRISRSLDFTISIEAQSVLSYLDDSEFAPFEFKGDAVDLFRQVIESHNGQVGNPDRQMVFRSTPYDARYYVELKEEKYSQSSGVISSILDGSEAYIDIYYEKDGPTYISLVTNFARSSAQQIMYGKNIVSMEIDDAYTDDYCNVVRGSSGDLLTDLIENADAIAFAGSKIIREVSFDGIDNMNDLVAKSREYLDKHCKIKQTVSATVVDMNLIDESIEKFRLGSMVEVYLPKLMIAGWYLIRGRKINIANPGENDYELGDSTQKLTDEVSVIKRRRWSRDRSL